MLLVPQWITATETEAGKYKLSARHKTCCVRSPPIPQLTVLKDSRWRPHTLGYRDRLRTIEAPRRITLACRRTIVFACVRWKPYHPNFVSRNIGLLKLIVNTEIPMPYLLIKGEIEINIICMGFQISN